MKALFQKKKQLTKWLENMFNSIVYYGKKNVRKLKGKPPEMTVWQIIKLLA